jgi:hypothetical protein
MRCSSCEPLLDAFLESALRPRQHVEVAAHVRECNLCAGLLGELRVIDALLITARPANVTSGFTQAIVTVARSASPHPVRQIPLWRALVAYLLIAWAVVGVVALQSNAVAATVASIVTSAERGASAVAAAARALAPATPLAAATVSGVLLLDVLLLAALFYGYRHLAPLLALYLTRGSRS